MENKTDGFSVWFGVLHLFQHYLTHFILNRLSHYIYLKSPISILGMPGYVMYIFLEKKAKLFANSGDPDQKPCSATSDLGLYCLPITF